MARVRVAAVELGIHGLTLEGLAGPVKRFGLDLTDNAEPSQSFRRGRDTGRLAFSKISPTTAGRTS